MVTAAWNKGTAPTRSIALKTPSGTPGHQPAAPADRFVPGGGEPEPKHNFANGAGHWAECIISGNAALGGAIACGAGALALASLVGLASVAAIPAAVVAGIGGAVAFFKMGEATGELAGDIGARVGAKLGFSEPTSKAAGKTLMACLMTCGLGASAVIGSLTGIGVAGLVSHLWGDRE